MPTIARIIMDGMDQGKFAYPRSPCKKAKDLGSLQRPRLHVNAAIAHGRQLLVTVAHADTWTNTNYNIEMLSIVLTKVKTCYCVASIFTSSSTIPTKTTKTT